jgi:hypothetical protein
MTPSLRVHSPVSTFVALLDLRRAPRLRPSLLPLVDSSLLVERRLRLSAAWQSRCAVARAIDGSRRLARR